MVSAGFCYDWGSIAKAIFDHWEEISEDGMDREKYILPMGCTYLALMRDGEIIGFQLYYKLNAITYEIHTIVLPAYRGLTASFLAQRCGWRLMFEKTDCEKIVAEIPSFRREVIDYAKRLGMQLEGINRSSWLKHGQIWDQLRLGLSKHEFCQTSSRRVNRFVGPQANFARGEPLRSAS